MDHHFDFDPERDRPPPVPPPGPVGVPVFSMKPSGSTGAPNTVDGLRGGMAYLLSFGFLQSVQHLIQYTGVLEQVLPPKYGSLLMAMAAGVTAFIVSWLQSGYAEGTPADHEPAAGPPPAPAPRLPLQ